MLVCMKAQGVLTQNRTVFDINRGRINPVAKCNGSLFPNMRDLFLKIVISPDLKGVSGILLDLKGLHDFD